MSSFNPITQGRGSGDKDPKFVQIVFLLPQLLRYPPCTPPRTELLASLKIPTGIAVVVARRIRGFRRVMTRTFCSIFEWAQIRLKSNARLKKSTFGSFLPKS